MLTFIIYILLSLFFSKYLFTAPRNLWQGSREEFCISFHDDKDIQANYLVTLSLADESDVLLGNGTTNGNLLLHKILLNILLNFTCFFLKGCTMTFCCQFWSLLKSYS